MIDHFREPFQRGLAAFHGLARENMTRAQAWRFLDMGLRIERAVYYDTVEKNAKAAVIAYRDFVRTFPMSNLRERAESRIAELSATMEKKP